MGLKKPSCQHIIAFIFWQAQTLVSELTLCKEVRQKTSKGPLGGPITGNILCYHPEGTIGVCVCGVVELWDSNSHGTQEHMERE